MAIGIEAEQFSAVDARHLDRYKGIRYVPHKGDRWEIPDSLIGCFESYRRLRQRVVDDDQQIRRTRRKLYRSLYGDAALKRSGGVIINSALDFSAIARSGPEPAEEPGG